MPLTPEQNEKIKQALGQKVRLPCPSCGSRVWAISDGLIMLQTQDQPSGLVIGGPALPNIAVICSVCGNTQLYNAFALGIADVLGIKPQTPPGEKRNG